MQPLPEPANVSSGPQTPSDPAGTGDTPDHGLSLLQPRRTPFRWYHKVAAIMTAIFCFELGIFLLIYPWVNEWDVNASVIPAWGRTFWTSAWFRGAVSGLGLLNILISFSEVFRFRRFSG